jgi:hypothetical protein
MSFEDYMIRKTEKMNNIDRAYNSIMLYNEGEPS